MNKWLITILGICLVISTGLTILFYYQASSYQRLNASLSKEIELKEQLYQNEISKAQKAILEQNKAIENYYANITDIQQSISIKDKELCEIQLSKQKEIVEQLNKDSSSNNQLKIVEDLLHDIAK